MAHFGHIIRWSCLVWSYDATLRSFQRKSGQDQVKKGQIFEFIYVDKKDAYLEPAFAQESNGVICFYVQPPKVAKNHI